MNPNKGLFDLYSTRLWPALVVLLLIAGLVSPHSGASSGALSGSTGSGPSTSGASTWDRMAPRGVSGTAHLCWHTANELNGCQDDTSSAMLFGTRTGTPTTCWFVEPLDDGESASCR